MVMGARSWRPCWLSCSWAWSDFFYVSAPIVATTAPSSDLLSQIPRLCFCNCCCNSHRMGSHLVAYHLLHLRCHSTVPSASCRGDTRQHQNTPQLHRLGISIFFRLAENASAISRTVDRWIGLKQNQRSCNHPQPSAAVPHDSGSVSAM